MNTYAIHCDADVPLGVECALPNLCAVQTFCVATGTTRRARWLLAVAVLALTLGAWQFGRGLYIHAKAELAQVLLSRAWERALAGERQAKPWPWADTWPVARLRVPVLNVDLFILAGSNGRAIAFEIGRAHV